MVCADCVAHGERSMARHCVVASQARDLFVYLDTNCNPWGCDTSKLDDWISHLAPVASECVPETHHLAPLPRTNETPPVVAER